MIPRTEPIALLLGLALTTGCYDLTVGRPSDGGTGDGADCDPGWAGASCDICVRFVTLAAPEDADYQTWATAGNSVVQAIQLAQSALQAEGVDVCEVWAAQGTYYVWGGGEGDTVELAPGVQVYGGFTGDETERDQRDFVANETILSGHAATVSAQVHHVVTGSDDAVIDGFTIEGGVADGDGLNSLGGGMINLNCAPTVRNCVFRNNHAVSGGGGMFNQYADPEVVNCRFHANSTAWVGGGVVNDYSSPFFENCTFSANTADESGGGMDSWSDDQDSPSVPVLHHCSFGGNSDGFTADGYFHVELRNCALDGEYALQLNLTEDNSAALHHCVIPGGSGDTVIDGDPLFADPVGGDLSINTNSPCIDAADSEYSPPTDIVGNPRVDDPSTADTGVGDPSYADIGAYEFQPG